MQVFEPRTGQVRYNAPDVEELGFEWPALKAAVAALDRLAEDYRDTGHKIRELHDSRREAEGKDREAFAAAIQDGKKDPGTKHVDELEKALDAATRRRDALKVAIEQQARTVAETIGEHRSEWRSEVTDRLPAATTRLEVAVQEVEDARAELHRLRGLEAWLETPGEPYKPGAAAKNTTTVIRGGINRRGQEPTLSAIREEARSA